MNNARLQQRLKELEQQRLPYEWIIKKLLDNPLSLTEEERVRFTEENIIKINELQLISKEIRDIKWELMGPEKQQEYIDKYKDD